MKRKPQEAKLAEQLVESLSEPFRLSQYHDECQDRLKALIEAKQRGREVTAAPEAHRTPVIDMMAALKQSLAVCGVARKQPARARRQAEHHRKPARRAR